MKDEHKKRLTKTKKREESKPDVRTQEGNLLGREAVIKTDKDLKKELKK